MKEKEKHGHKISNSNKRNSRYVITKKFPQPQAGSKNFNVLNFVIFFIKSGIE